MVKHILVFTHIVEIILKVPGAPATRNVNPAQAITWLVGETIYCTIFQEQLTST